ncbi:hypothetical protein GCM10007160_39790 [Litchfieldella qijiaojingensis]|uniref:IDEAL domain-containing protein n=1 Tax=Litchfieldella qijiaojingensis TaxID=980347 RepID=A0ABQ2Z8J6_9GAMM|nr:hypothetical protein GCM10007160_39790 [Halomonas qijiaojingensis]
MKLTRSEFGKMLANKLEETNDVTILSRWAYDIFLRCQREVDSDFRGLLLDLARMEDAQEFEYSIDELRKLAKELQGQHCSGI